MRMKEKRWSKLNEQIASSTGCYKPVFTFLHLSLSLSRHPPNFVKKSNLLSVTNPFFPLNTTLMRSSPSTLEQKPLCEQKMDKCKVCMPWNDSLSLSLLFMSGDLSSDVSYFTFCLLINIGKNHKNKMWVVQSVLKQVLEQKCFGSSFYCKQNTLLCCMTEKLMLIGPFSSFLRNGLALNFFCWGFLVQKKFKLRERAGMNLEKMEYKSALQFQRRLITRNRCSTCCLAKSKFWCNKGERERRRRRIQ